MAYVISCRIDIVLRILDEGSRFSEYVILFLTSSLAAMYFIYVYFLLEFVRRNIDSETFINVIV